MSGKSESKSPQIIGKVKTVALKLELESNGEKSTSVRVGKKKEDRTELESVRERILSSKRVGEPKKSELEAVRGKIVKEWGQRGQEVKRNMEGVMVGSRSQGEGVSVKVKKRKFEDRNMDAFSACGSKSVGVKKISEVNNFWGQ